MPYNKRGKHNQEFITAAAAATTTITDVFVYGVRITEDKPSAAA